MRKSCRWGRKEGGWGSHERSEEGGVVRGLRVGRLCVMGNQDRAVWVGCMTKEKLVIVGGRRTERFLIRNGRWSVLRNKGVSGMRRQKITGERRGKSHHHFR